MNTNTNPLQKMRIISALLLVCLLTSSFAPFSITSQETPSLSEIAAEISEDVGFVEDVYESDSDHTVFIFKENHAFLIGQIEIAIMLNRLYADYDLRNLGIEGYDANEEPLDLTWAHRPPAYVPRTPITSREDVMSYMLAEGEVNSAEFLGMIYEDVVVHGVEDMDLYQIDVEMQVYMAPDLYLYYIALAQMDEQEMNLWNGYMDQERFEEAFEFALGTDEYTTEMKDRFMEDLSADDFIAKYEEIIAYADDNEVEIPPELESDMDLMLGQMDVVNQRSEAMVENILTLLATEEFQGPLAVHVGSTHSSLMAELLKENGVSYVVIDSLSREEGFEGGMLDQEAYMRKVEGLSVGGEGTLGALLDNRKKPQPTAHKDLVISGQMLRELYQEIVQLMYLVHEKSGIPFKQASETKNIKHNLLKVEKNKIIWTKLNEMGIELEILKYKPPHKIEALSEDREFVSAMIEMDLPGYKWGTTVILDVENFSKLPDDNLEEALERILADFKAKSISKESSQTETDNQNLASSLHQNCSNTWYTMSTGQ
ncbi:MAG: hypothetical protein ISR58_18755 [Anaerolineales bacterium]|nr:hypothetical protein [Anaerolineales bacterium]